MLAQPEGARRRPAAFTAYGTESGSVPHIAAGDDGVAFHEYVHHVQAMDPLFRYDPESR